MRNALKICYISLANWQDGVGDTDVGIDFTQIDPNSDTNEFAKSVSSQAFARENWSLKVKAERKTLIGGLQTFGLWDSNI